MSEKDFEDKMKPTTKDVTMSEEVYLEMIDDFNNLQKQLQAYKDKEDKLREFLTSCKDNWYTEYCVKEMCEYVLKTLDGRDENE